MDAMFSEDIKIEIAKEFNKKPKNGINAIIDFCKENNIEDIDKQIAEFFIEQKENLDLEAVGDYLGTEGELNKKVLDSFTQKFDFQNKTFTEGLREFLFSYKLPGEAQKIDRLVESFSNVYFDQQREIAERSGNNQIFANADAVYILAFQTIMLNTDLHNPSIQNHMPVDSLKRNLRGSNGDQNFPDEFLSELHQEIKDHPFELNFTKTPPGIQLNSNLLKYDNTFDSFKAYMSNGSNKSVEDLLPNVSNANNIHVEIDKPRPLLVNLMGYNGTLNLIDNKTGAKCSVQIYEPNIFSKILFNEKPKIIIQPSGEGNDDHSLKLAAQVAASFKTEPSTFKSTYAHEADSMKSEFQKSRENSVSRSHVSASSKSQPNEIIR